MKRVLVTGCSGYIGSHLCDMLVKNGYHVDGMDKKMPKVSVRTFYLSDITSRLDVQHEYDCVVHLAALVRVGEAETRPLDYFLTNVSGTSNVLGSIRTKNFVFASTGAAEGSPGIYGKTKQIAEGLVQDFNKKIKDVDFTIFRFYNVIGSDGYPPTNPDGLFYKLLESKDTGKFTIYGIDYNTKDGTCIRDYVHVNEICSSILEAIETPSNSIECLGHGTGYSVKEIADIFQEVNNCHIQIDVGPRRDGDQESSVLNSVSPYMKNLYSIEELLRIK